tara:strand:- start:102806 stop:103528 length:723 start_codon:yes stop_codon:yes gene_type:complete
MNVRALTEYSGTTPQRHTSLFESLLSPAPEFKLSLADDENRYETEDFIQKKFHKIYAAYIDEFYPVILCMRCFGSLSATAGMRVARSTPLFLEQYLDQNIEVELSQLIGSEISRNSIVEIGNLVASQRGASHILFLLFTTILHRAGYQWITFTTTRALQNNLRKLGFELHYLCEADPSKLEPKSGSDWGTYYNTQPQVVAGNLDNAMQIIQSRPLFRRILRLYRSRINALVVEFKSAHYD